MVVLHQSKPMYGLPSISPFSIKLELFLKAAGIEYEVSHSGKGAPKRKIPFIEHKCQLMGDSSLIMEVLTKDFNVTLDDHLSASQRAVGFMVCRALEEGHYFCGVYMGWKVDANWPDYRDHLFEQVPKWIRTPVAGLFRKYMAMSLYLQGTGRHSQEEVENLGLRYMRELGVILNSNAYLLGDRFSSYDCTVYGFLARIFRVNDQSKAADYVRGNSAFRDYCRRIEAEFEIAEPLPSV